MSRNFTMQKCEYEPMTHRLSSVPMAVASSICKNNCNNKNCPVWQKFKVIK